MNLISKVRRRILIRRVNKALHIKLTDWQIAHIFDDIFPSMAFTPGRTGGKTTAGILRLLLNPKFNGVEIFEEVSEKPQRSPKYFAECVKAAYLFGEDGVNAHRRYFFMRELLKVKDQLKARHIKTNTVCFLYHGRRHHYI